MVPGMDRFKWVDLERISQGRKYYSVIYRGSFRVHKRSIMIIASNHTPQEVYPEVNEDVIKARFYVCNLFDYLNSKIKIIN